MCVYASVCTCVCVCVRMHLCVYKSLDVHKNQHDLRATIGSGITTHDLK